MGTYGNGANDGYNKESYTPFSFCLPIYNSNNTLCIIGGFTSFSAVSAKNNNPPVGPVNTVEELTSKYSLKTVESIPPGIEPIVFNSVAKADAYLSTLNKGETTVSESVVWNTKNEYSILSETVYGTVTRSCSKALSLAYFNTWADIGVALNGSFRWITGVLNTRTGLTGVTTGMELHDNWSYYYNLTSTSVNVKGGGIVDYYLNIGGKWVFYSKCRFTLHIGQREEKE